MLTIARINVVIKTGSSGTPLRRPTSGPSLSAASPAPADSLRSASSGRFEYHMVVRGWLRRL